MSDAARWTGDVTDEDQRPGDAAPTEASVQPVQRTGNSAVDEVLASLDGLQDRPVAEHVAVFDAAHEQLRAALADAGDPAAG